MSAPRLEIDLGRITANTRVLVERLAPTGIRVVGVTKAALGSPAVGAAMVRGGAGGLGDSRVENLDRLRGAGPEVPLTLVRSPMPSQVDAVVRCADRSLNTDRRVVEALSHAAGRAGSVHAVVLMVELGDLREGVAADEVLDLAEVVRGLPHLVLAGLGTNLACQSGVVPDQEKMDELSALADQVERAGGPPLSVVSGGNSANLDWVLGSADVGRIDELRLGESILLGTEPLQRRPIEGLHTDACTLVAEVIEAGIKAVQPWGTFGQGAFGSPAPVVGTGRAPRAILAVGRQDVDPDGLRPPPGMAVLGASSDHLVLSTGDGVLAAGDEVRFGVDYSALVRAATSPFVTVVTVGGPTTDG